MFLGCVQCEEFGMFGRTDMPMCFVLIEGGSWMSLNNVGLEIVFPNERGVVST